MKLSIDFDKQTQAATRKLIRDQMDRMRNTGTTMSKIAIALYQSVMKNFSEQGTDKERWKGLAPSTIAGRRKGKGSGSARILMDTGFMRANIHPEATETEASVGLNGEMAKLGRIHHFGIPSKENPRLAGRNHSVRIPARPFMVLRAEYNERILNIVRKDMFPK